MNLQDLRRDIRNAGVGGALFDVAYRAFNRRSRVMVLQMMVLTPDALAPGFLKEDRWRPSFLDEEMLRRFGRDPANELDEAFLDRALAKGDRCMAILDGSRLAAYGWYSDRETEVTLDLALSFAPGWIYMYKGFTHPDYRGLRLHARGMAGALIAYAEEGRRGLVSFVEANNYSSLRSVHRMGYRDAGRILVVCAFGRQWIVQSPRCRHLQISLHRRRRDLPPSAPGPEPRPKPGTAGPGGRPSCSPLPVREGIAPDAPASAAGTLPSLGSVHALTAPAARRAPPSSADAP